MKLKLLSILALCVFFLSACGIYTFSDASIPPEVKTIKINYFKNSATLINPILANNLTEDLRTRVQNQTRLFLISKANIQCDYEVEGTITEYYVSTQSISNNQVATNQLNISVMVSFKNNLSEQLPNIKNFEETFTINRQFAATLTLQQAESENLELMIKDLNNKIFNKLFSSW